MYEWLIETENIINEDTYNFVYAIQSYDFKE